MPEIIVNGLVPGILAIIAGIIIIIWPRIIAYIVGVYLVVIGIIAIINAIK